MRVSATQRSERVTQYAIPDIHRADGWRGDMAPTQQMLRDTAGFPRDEHRAVAYAGESACATDLRLAWPVILLRGLPARCGSLRRFQARFWRGICAG
jgi:hypothetical protein